MRKSSARVASVDSKSSVRTGASARSLNFQRKPQSTASDLDLSELTFVGSASFFDDEEEAEDGGALVDDEEEAAGMEHESVTIFCTCEEFKQKELEELLSRRFSKRCRWKYGQICVPLHHNQSSLLVNSLQEPSLANEEEYRCVIFFVYGVVAMWGLTPGEEQQVLEQIVPQVQVRALPSKFVEREKTLVRYCEGETVSIRNDTLWLPSRVRGLISTRIAISYAFAQSTKLSLFEEQGLDLVQSTAHLPQELAERGHCSLSRRNLSKLVGRLFVHKNGLDRLHGVLDTPEYFWSKADALQELYKAVAKYLEIDERIEAVKSRLDMIQELFDMLQSRDDAHHGTMLEVIVIVLVALEFIIGVMEFCGTIGIISPIDHRPNLPRSFASRIVSLVTASSE